VMRGNAPARQSLALPIERAVVFGRATLWEPQTKGFRGGCLAVFA
jgi:hypothetical protein